MVQKTGNAAKQDYFTFLLYAIENPEGRREALKLEVYEERVRDELVGSASAGNIADLLQNCIGMLSMQGIATREPYQVKTLSDKEEELMHFRCPVTPEEIAEFRNAYAQMLAQYVPLKKDTERH